MLQQQKQLQRKQKKKTAARRGDTPRNNILSFRISDLEKRELDRITRASARNVSDIAREAIELWMRKHAQVC